MSVTITTTVSMQNSSWKIETFCTDMPQIPMMEIAHSINEVRTSILEVFEERKAELAEEPIQITHFKDDEDVLTPLAVDDDWMLLILRYGDKAK